MKSVLLAAVIATVTMTTAFSQQSAEQRAFNINQFNGWTGIVLACKKNDTNPEVVKAICDVAKSEFTYLAENSRIPYRISVNDDMLGLTVLGYEIGKPIVLKLRTLPTRNNTLAKAIYVQISAENFYSNVVDKEASPTDPEGMPRSEDLSLWSGSLIASGTDTEAMVRHVTPYIGRHIKDFLGAFTIDQFEGLA